MEDEVMEQIKSRLAAATSAATELAKSLDALDENTLQTLEVWLAKQEGELKCAKCRALMPRGRETSVCIACGCTRPPFPNTPAYDFKVSFAFLQFLETIHPPVQSGSRKSWNPIVSIAPESEEPETVTAEREAAVTSSADVSVEPEEAEEMPVERGVAVAIEPVQHTKEQLVIDENIYLANLQERPSSVDSSGMVDDTEADDFGDFQDSAVEPSHEVSEDVVIQNGYSHSNQFQEAAKVEKEPEAVFAGAAVNAWDTEWDYPPSQFVSAKTENGSPDNMPENSMDVTHAAPQVPEYDFSIFESFAGNGSKEENVSPNTDADAAFWDSHTKNIVNSRLASIKAMERFASDTSAFTTITDADSDSGDSSLEALPPPPKLPLDIEMEFGAYSGQNDLLGSLPSHELVDFQRVAASSHPLATPPTSQHPFRWMLEPLDGLSNQVSGDDVQNVEKSSAGTFETSSQVAVDPFSWPLEEFGSGSKTMNHATTQQGALELMDTGRPQSVGNGVDPFSWPLDTFSQDLIGVNKDDAVGTVSADVAEDETEDWGDEEFVWSQAEPVQFTSNLDLLPSSTSFSSNIVAGDTFMDKDSFFHDQSSPIPSVSVSPNYGSGLESLVTTNGEKTVVEEDLLKSIHVKSLSFGDHDKKANVDDLSKRSVSFGNLQVKGDELLKVLQTFSISKPAEPAEDILNFLNLKPASSVPDVAKPSHVRSVSFDTVELVPDEQSDEMFQFFHTRSHSAGSSATKSSTVENGASSTPKTLTPVVDDDPFSFIHTAISPSAQSETVEVKADDDDDDDFEWKSAEMPATAPSEAVLPAPSQPDSIFEWTSRTPKSSGLSGLLSLAGGLPPSQTRTSSKEDDLVAALSRNSSNTGVVQAKQATVQVAIEPVHSLKLGDDSDDEFSDFVSTEALPSAPPLSTRQPSQPAFDVSFFEAAQPNPSEKRNLDFFGDLMGLNFTNA